MDKILLLFLIFHSCYGVIYRLNDTEYHKMPPLFDMDDYELCLLDRGGTYCMLDVHLQAGTNPDLMKMIQGYSEATKKHFNHTILHRAICVTRTCKDFITDSGLNDTKDLTHTLEACLNSSLFSQYGLEGRVADVQYCDKEGDTITIDNTDIAMAVVYLLIIVLNVVGSFYDILKFNKDDDTGNPYLLAFSMRRNWAKLTASSKSAKPRIQRLKFFHGIRTLTMVCVIFSHITIIVALDFSSNPQYIERAYDDPSKQILFNGSLVTLIFFVMSSFLLAYNFELTAEKTRVSWWMLPKGILLRWLRLTATYALTMFSISTWVRHMFRGPLWPTVVTSEAIACRRYWWTNLLYINNYIYDNALCMPQTWYLAADTQLFCVGLVVCVAARSRRARTVTLALLLAVGLAIVAGQTYFQDLNAIVLQSPEVVRSLFAGDDTFRLMYICGHTNLSSCAIGLALGFLVYYGLNNKDPQQYKKYRWVVWLVFPLGVMTMLSGYVWYADDWSPPTAARVLYATFHKTFFDILFAILTFGCVFKVESVYRGILEWRVWAPLSRVSYSAFLVHTVIQRAIGGMQMRLFHFNDYTVIVLLAGSLFMSYIAGGVMSLCVEMPAALITRAALVRDTEPSQAKVPGELSKPINTE